MGRNCTSSWVFSWRTTSGSSRASTWVRAGSWAHIGSTASWGSDMAERKSSLGCVIGGCLAFGVVLLVGLVVVIVGGAGAGAFLVMGSAPDPAAFAVSAPPAAAPV